MANAPIVVAEGDEDIELEYDSDGYPIIPERAKVSLETTPTLVVLILLSCQVVDPLPPVDHSEVTTLTLHTISHYHTTTPTHPQIDYPGFNRDFYSEHEVISSLSSAEVKELKAKLGLKVTGFQAPKPCVSFAHFNFDENLMSLIRRLEYSQPTGIQSQVGGGHVTVM